MVELDGLPERSMSVRREPDTRRMAIQARRIVLSLFVVSLLPVGDESGELLSHSSAGQS